MIRHVFSVAQLNAAHGTSAHKERQRANFRVAHPLRLRFHHAGGQRFINMFRRHFADSGGQRRALHCRIAVALHTFRLERKEAEFGTRRPRARFLGEGKGGGKQCR